MKIYMLVDRSGSMGTNWIETIGSVNTYIEHLNEKDAGVYVAVFDDYSYDVVRNTNVGSWSKLSPTEVTPRGSTPLRDAFGKLSVAAEETNDPNSIIVVMTDGFENASKEWSHAMVTAKMIEFENKRKWPVVFLGANFSQANTMAVASSIGTVKSMGAVRGMSVGTMDSHMYNLAQQSNTYAVSGLAESFTYDESQIEDKK